MGNNISSLNDAGNGRSKKRPRHSWIGDKVSPTTAVASLGVFETTPPDAFAIILECLDIASLVALSGCSSSLGRFVYGQRWLWATVDFSKADAAKAGQVTDSSLQSLLERIDARKVTRVLSLRGCKSIRGPGLFPLFGSVTLEEIDLRVEKKCKYSGGKTSLHTWTILGILDSIRLRPKSRLSVVYFMRRWCNRGDLTPDLSYFDLFEKEIGEWLRKLNQSVEDRVIKRDQVECDHCGGCLMAPPKNRAGLSMMAFAYCCHKCGKNSCSKGEHGCPKLRQCNWCQAIICDLCTKMKICNDGGECGSLACDDCATKVMQTCAACHESVCFPCLDDAMGENAKEACRDCKKVFCSPGYGCNALNRCGVCSTYGKLYCRECRDCSRCGGCDNKVCDKCKPVSCCAKCKRVLQCSPRNCDDFSCAISTCEVCERTYCSGEITKNCNETFYCEGCGTNFCRSCRQAGGCDWCCRIECSDECCEHNNR